MTVNLNPLKYFFVVMEEHSITKAAHKMRVSQPTVTYNIKILERDLRTQLFTVGRYGICPEPAAWQLYHQLKPFYSGLVTYLHQFMPMS